MQQTLTIDHKLHLASFKMELEKNNLDAFIIRNFEGDNHNVYYLSGFSGTTAVLLITKNGQYIFSDARYWSRIEKEAAGFELVKIERNQKIISFIDEMLLKLNFDNDSKIGFEGHNISYNMATKWITESRFKLIPCTNLIEKLRQYKTDFEIEQIKHACQVTAKVFKEVKNIVAPGMTESQIAYELDTRLRKYGATANSFSTIVAAGPNSAIPHHKTGDYVVKPGDPVVMDFGGLFPGGYCSDLTRTIFAKGGINPKMIEIYNSVLEANQKVAKELKPGMNWKQFDGIARESIKNRGYDKYFTHGLGHSVGLLVHDPFDYENCVFEPGTVITNEPGIYIEGLGGVRIEDDMLVTSNGSINMTIDAPYETLS